MRNIEGNSDANGSLDIGQPYMQETYPEMRARLEREMAERAVNDDLLSETEPEPPVSIQTDAWQW